MGTLLVNATKIGVLNNKLLLHSMSNYDEKVFTFVY